MALPTTVPKAQRTTDIKLNMDIGTIPITLEAKVSTGDGSKGDANKDIKLIGSATNLDVKLNKFLDELLDQLGADKELSNDLEDLLPEVTLTNIYVCRDVQSDKTKKTKRLSFVVQGTVDSHKFDFFFASFSDSSTSASSSSSGYAFGLRCTTSIKFAELPLVGSYDGLKDIGIEELGFLYVKTEGSYSLPTFDGKQLQVNDPKPQKQGLVIQATLNHGGAPEQLSLPLTRKSGTATTQPKPSDEQAGEKDSAGAPQASPQLAPAAPSQVTPSGAGTAPAAATSSSASIKWLGVNKSFGPVSLEKIGLGYSKGQVSFSIVASFTLAGLTVGLQGLRISTSLKAFDPSFDLDGLGLDFRREVLEIGGAFLHLGDDYLGQAIVKAETFSLTAIGGYAPRYESFFIFARLNYPLGGPPFFYVTGLAAGFGINRRLVLPTIDQLPDYFLLPQKNQFPAKLSSGNDLATVLTNIEKQVPPAPGENWVAVGVDFTSFGTVTSSALVTVAFGVKLEIALLGISHIQTPKGSPVPLSYFEITLEARYSQDSGVLAIDGFITPASYIYSGLCHITGGFAFYTWFSGPHEGDFVVTVGGYHPRFVKPPHYPPVSRLSMIYQVGELILKGSAYFALTPHMLMAGLQIEATWNSGDIKAWFNASLDFLLGWKPFHYEVDASIQIGASVNLDLLFTTVSLTIHVGVELHIWGPPFGGRAVIDLDIISFSITFGEAQQKELLDWDTFKKTCLPPAQKDADPKSDQHLCTASVSVGLLQDVRAAQDKQDKDSFSFDWIVDPNHFCLVTNTLIPAKTASFNDQNNIEPKGTNELGVLPMGLAATDFTSDHSVQINKLKPGGDYTKKDDYTDPDKDLTPTPVKKSAPAALWWGDASKPLDLNDKTLIGDTLAGLQLTPEIQRPETTCQADLWAMLFDATQSVTCHFSQPKIDPSDSFAAKPENGKLTFQSGGQPVTCSNYKLSDLTNPKVAPVRQDVVQSLHDLKVVIDQQIEVGGLAEYPLWDWPMIRSLGEELPA